MAEKSRKSPVHLSYQQKKSLYGYGFISLWLVGTVIFFLVPLVKSLAYSFSDVSIGTGHTALKFAGLKKYLYVLGEDEYYTRYLSSTLTETLWKTPLILIFSLFIAVILNQKFKGRALARAVFFLPVIIATGPVYPIITGDIARTGNSGAQQFSTLFSTDLVGGLLQFLGLYGISDSMGSYISGIADNIFGIVWNSGIQIIVFLAGLQNIPPSAREAAQVEGATAWEYFWKITFPFVSPYIVANLIFTVIDSFRSPTNDVMRRIHDMGSDWRFGEASAMAWIYFSIILAAVGLVTFVVNRLIYYEVD